MSRVEKVCPDCERTLHWLEFHKGSGRRLCKDCTRKLWRDNYAKRRLAETGLPVRPKPELCPCCGQRKKVAA